MIQSIQSKRDTFVATCYWYKFFLRAVRKRDRGCKKFIPVAQQRCAVSKLD